MALGDHLQRVAETARNEPAVQDGPERREELRPCGLFEESRRERGEQRRRGKLDRRERQWIGARRETAAAEDMSGEEQRADAYQRVAARKGEALGDAKQIQPRDAERDRAPDKRAVPFSEKQQLQDRDEQQLHRRDEAGLPRRRI